MTTYACYIVTSFWAYGELHMALDLAGRQRAAGIEPVFLIPPSHVELTRAKGIRYETLIPGGGKLNVMLMRDIERRFRPKSVVLADFLNYNFCERHYGLTLDDLDVFSAPVSTFDIYDFGRTGGRVDTYGFYAKNMRGISVDRFHHLLQPSPIVPPGTPRNDQIIKYPLFEHPARAGARERDLARRELGLGSRERVVLVTSALWQKMHRSYEAVLPFIGACKQALDEILATVAKDATVISVGASSVGETREIPGLRRYGHLPTAQFDQIAAACDLYVSNNYISTSMGRLVLQGVPTMLIQNSVSKHPDGGFVWFGRENDPPPPLLDAVPRAYPFRMYPVGWHSFLRPVVADNDFYRIMRHAELFDVDGSVALIEAILNGDDARRSEHAWERFRTQLERLPTAAEIGLP
jgi:hypothetical protein